MSKLFNKRFNSLSMEVADIRSQNTSVSDKLEDVQNVLTKQELSTQAQINEVKSALSEHKKGIENLAEALKQNQDKILKAIGKAGGVSET